MKSFKVEEPQISIGFSTRIKRVYLRSSRELSNVNVEQKDGTEN
jgi:hypothetical protein